MAKRDPRVNPHPGDIIEQRTGLRLKVKSAGDLIVWERYSKQKKRWVYDNTWSLSGWRDIVAKDSKVI